MAGRLFQVIDHLGAGEGVSNVARAFVPILAGAGGERPIVVLEATAEVEAETRPLDSVVWRADDAVVVHVYGYTRLQRFLETFPGRILLYFHDITPPEWFRRGTPLHFLTCAGWTQMPRLAELAHAWAAPSTYDLDELAAVAPAARPRRVVPPVLDPDAERGRRADPDRVAALRARGETNVLSVGRLAPHKRLEQVMLAFDRYHRLNPQSRLHLVGSPDDAAYARALDTFRGRLPSAAAIELPGKVDDAALAAYFQTADLYLTCTAHEGFCLPPLVAAAHGVPVLARALAALPETVAPAALLLHADDPGRTAEVMHAVCEDAGLRATLDAAARAHLRRFAAPAVAAAWRAALAGLGR